MKKDIKRTFDSVDESGKTVTLGIVIPTQKIIQDAQLQYAKAFSKCLRDGLLVNAEAQKVIRDRDLWDKNVEQEFYNLTKDIAAKEKILNDGIILNDKNLTDTAYEVAFLREKRYQLQRQTQSIYNNTAENRADEVRVQYLTSQCIVDAKTGEAYFKSFDDFLEKLDTKIAADCSVQMMTYMNGLDANFMDNLPEARYIKKLAELSEEEEKKQIEEVVDKEPDTKSIDVPQVKEEENNSDKQEETRPIEETSIEDKK